MARRRRKFVKRRKREEDLCDLDGCGVRSGEVSLELGGRA